VSDRRDFLKSITVLALASVVPDVRPEKLVISATSNADQMIGIERMRIMSNGSVGMSMVNPNTELKLRL